MKSKKSNKMTNTAYIILIIITILNMDIDVMINNFKNIFN